MKKLGTLMSIFSIQQLSAKPESIRIEEIPVISQSQFAQGKSYVEKILDLAQNQTKIRLAVSGSALVCISTLAYSCISSSDPDKLKESIIETKNTLSEEITKASNLGEELKNAKNDLREEIDKASNLTFYLEREARIAENTLSEEMTKVSNRIEYLKNAARIIKNDLREEIDKASDRIRDLKNAQNTLSEERS